MFRITVQVQAVVPVRPANERKSVGTFMGGDKVKGTFQMFHQRNCSRHIVVKRYLLFQNGNISGLPDIGVDCGNEPQRIIVEPAADVGISLFRQRLVLVVSASVRELGGGNVQDPFSCPFRDQMKEAQKILARIPESHASADTGFIVGGRTGHVEGYHTLILVPDVHHTVYFLIGRRYLEAGQQLFPVLAKFLKGLVHSLFIGIFFQQFSGFGLIYHIGSLPFLFLGIFCIAKNKNKGFTFPWLQAQIQLVGGDRVPAAGYRIGQFPCQHSFGCIRSLVNAQKSVPAGIKMGHRSINTAERVVVPAFSVFGLVIDSGAFDLHFAGA